MKPEYAWRLTWNGYKDHLCLRSLVDYLKVFPLFRDSKAHLIDYDEYQKLIADGKLEPARSYWKISEGEVGLISESYYSRYTNTWDLISTAKRDYEEGWEACEARHRFLADWDEAIAMDKARKDGLKTRVRRATIPISTSLTLSLDLEAYRKRYQLLYCEWKETRHGRPIDKEGNYTLIIKAKCTESELQELASEIYYDITY